jgi:5-methylcytosine-specific restriction enzyme A
MPFAPKSKCTYPRCPEYKPCKVHNQCKQDYKTPHERELYGSTRWKKARALHLAENPLCVECEKENRYVPATVCDHVIRLRVDPSRALDSSNFSGLCETHHAIKRQREKNQ